MNYLAYEVNFDSLVGPTHFYGGLAYGNKASMESRGDISNPKLAALQGLEKMRFLHRLGIKQALLPPHERPYLPLLKSLGFTGTVSSIFNQVKEKAPWILEQSSSSASMWTANAATVTPAIDSTDNHTHLTPANLVSHLHRSIETPVTYRILNAIFTNPVYFKVHEPVPCSKVFSDEGAANHSRFAKSYNGPGVHLFCYSQALSLNQEVGNASIGYPGRQTLEASEAIVRLHQIFHDNILFAKQHPEAINAGAFHNDVICVGNLNFLLLHEFCFARQKEILELLRKKVETICEADLQIIEIKNDQISLQDAVKSYLFNSQIVSLPDESMALIAPVECQSIPSVSKFLSDLTETNDNPIGQVHFVDLNQSMKNGGGPACLRLRVVLNEQEFQVINPNILFSDTLFEQVSEWIHKHYPESISIKDLANAKIYEKNCKALDELTTLLNLGKIYSFQQ
ncbi:N-succinylarginine dihydrolase [Chlamydiales bacterium STE3]|nr:N-succinylarginine dihydrolase [Chlamydiales bacterium STE3]